MVQNKKVVIVGAGNVGMALAYSILNRGLCRELVLIDLNQERVCGEVMDLQHAAACMQTNMRILAGSYRECRDADIVVITASAPMSLTDNNRLDMLDKSKKIMGMIVPQIKASGFNGILLVVSNPVDVMTYYAWRLSGLPAGRVIGSGAVLDTARLKLSLSDLFNVSPKSIDVNMIGEHGDSEVVVWSTAAIGGKKISDVMADNTARAGQTTFEQLKKDVASAGWEIFHRKGNTSYGIASSVSSIIASILNDEECICPVSVYVNGFCGIEDVYFSLPAVLNRDGVREIVELKLSPEEEEGLRTSAETLKKSIEKLV